DLSAETPPVNWTVLEGDPERTYRAMNLGDLKQIAKLSGGRFYRPWETAALPGHLPTGSSLQLQRQVMVSLWNRWELLVLLTVLLCVDWYYRR
ncbi:MAG: hypothetical protein KDA90_13080, partial [Planctomycetaceae bacterium]|nr:hypothetical protein [Planctomycetaceae bacterium]